PTGRRPAAPPASAVGDAPAPRPAGAGTPELSARHDPARPGSRTPAERDSDPGRRPDRRVRRQPHLRPGLPRRPRPQRPAGGHHPPRRTSWTRAARADTAPGGPALAQPRSRVRRRRARGVRRDRPALALPTHPPRPGGGHGAADAPAHRRDLARGGGGGRRGPPRPARAG